PMGFHLTNVILHASNAVLFYFTAKRLFRAGRLPEDRPTLPAILAALLFAVHPLRAESVAWASERKDVLSGFFYFLTLLFYLRFVDGSRHRGAWYAAALTAYAASLCSKAATVTLPVAMTLLDVYPLSRFKTPSRNLSRNRTIWLE